MGTLNYITPRKRVEAARLVEHGIVVSLAFPLTSGAADAHIELTGFHTDSPDPASGAPPFAGDNVAIEVHQSGVTHLDCVSHIGSHEGLLYNARPIADTIDQHGVGLGSIHAQRGGIMTRGVLLDVAACRGLDWLDPTEEITPDDLERAERHGGVEVSSGDAVVVRTGVETRMSTLGPHPLAAGPGPAAAVWMHRREVALYTGDAPDHISARGAAILGRLRPEQLALWPQPETRFPLPFHQIAIPAMGLVLLDHARVEELAATCRELGRHEFLFMASPLAIPGGSGSPVNPLAVF